MSEAPFENWAGFKNIEPPLPEWQPSSNPATIEIPGLDTTASINDQMDQMDQLITIKLQNIDANFQKVHDIMANRILPAFRRYAESTEPIREAARFWLSFYEAAAKTSMPVNEGTTDSQYEQSDVTGQTTTVDETGDDTVGRSDARYQNSGEDHDQMSFDPDATRSEANFSHNPAISSTPLHPPSHGSFDMTNDDFGSVDSLSASLETPMQRLGRQIHNLDMDTGDSHRMRTEPTPSRVFGLGRTPAPSKTKGKGKESSSALREGVLRQNMSRGPPPAGTPKRRNPFVPSSKSGKKWDGIVDLARSPGVPRFSPRKHQDEFDEDTAADTSDDIWPPGMSPLQTIRIDIPGVPNVQPSPRKPRDASKRIAEGLLASVASARDATYLNGAGRQDNTGTTGTEFSTPSMSGLRWRRDNASESHSSLSSLPLFEGIRAESEQRQILDGSIPISQDDDSFDSDNGQPGGAFNFLAQHAKKGSDSDSDSDGSDDGTINPAFANVPLADGDDSFDDSFDEPVRSGTGTNLFAPRGPQSDAFNLKGQDLLDDTLGIGDVLKARAGAVKTSTDSPTPFGMPAGSKH